MVIVDHVWERGTEHRDRRAEHDTRAIVEPARPNSVEEEPRSVDVDAVALLEIGLRLTRNHRGEVENDVGSTGNQIPRHRRVRQIGGKGLDTEARAWWTPGLDNVDE